MDKNTMGLTKSEVVIQFKDRGYIIKPDVWKRWVEFGLLPIGQRLPTGKRGGKTKYYPVFIIKQVQHIIDFETQSWSRAGIIISLFVMGYQVDWDKLRCFFLDQLQSFEGFIKSRLPESSSEIPGEIQDYLLDESKKNNRFKNRGNPSSEQRLEHDIKIEHDFAQKMALIAMMPSLLGNQPKIIPEKSAQYLEKHIFAFLYDGNLSVNWVQLNYWKQRVQKMNEARWLRIQIILHTFFGRYLEPLLNTSGFPISLRDIFVRADFAFFYLLPLTRSSIRRLLNLFVTNEELYSKFQEHLLDFQKEVKWNEE
jgi:hypothetical protein